MAGVVQGVPGDPGLDPGDLPHLQAQDDPHQMKKPVAHHSTASHDNSHVKYSRKKLKLNQSLVPILVVS